MTKDQIGDVRRAYTTAPAELAMVVVAYERKNGKSRVALRGGLQGGPWERRSWDWEAGNLNGPLLNEIGAVVENFVLEQLLRVEGVQTTLAGLELPDSGE